MTPSRAVRISTSAYSRRTDAARSEAVRRRCGATPAETSAEPDAVPDKDTLEAADDDVMDPTALLTDMLGAQVIEETSSD